MASRVILLADDDDMLLDLMKGVLEDEGHIVLTASDGAAAARKAAERSPHLVVLDVDMPLMGGFGALEALKADMRTRRIPVVMLTAHKSEQHVRRAVELGAVGYIAKPFTAEGLLQRIRRFL